MRALMRPLVLLSLVVAAFLGGAPASATTRCAGERSLLYVCLITPPLFVTETYCVYTGGSSCTEIDLPTPGSGAIDVTCEGMLAPTSC